MPQRQWPAEIKFEIRLDQSRIVANPYVTGLCQACPSFARTRCHETLVLPEWNGVGDCFLCVPKKSLQRNYPRDLTEFEARFANEPACPGLPVPTALARGLSLTPSLEE